MNDKTSKSTDQLSIPWQRCLTLAMEGAAEGSLAIGAVITDPGGAVISGARNHLRDSKGSSSVKNNDLAHAELNAIINLPPEFRKRRDLTLYTTVEPCPLCMGAIVMSRIRDVKVASKDSWAGATGLLEKDGYMKSKKIKITFEGGLTEKIFFIIYTVSIWIQEDKENRLSHPVFKAYESEYPEYYRYITELVANEAFTGALAEKRDEEIIKIISSL